MKQTKLLCLVLALVLVLGLGTPAHTVAAAGQHNYSQTSNSGIRDEVCTTLEGTTASSYYTGSYSYDALSGKSQDALLQALRTLMKETHKKNSTYDDCKYMADKTDSQKENGKITLIYTSKQVTHKDFQNGNGWNREHVWPKSLGGFDKSGAGADLHHIRPSDNQVNSTRGNKLYGNVSGGSAAIGGDLVGKIAGGHYSGNYFEPLDNVKGDVARICLYVYVRYGGELSKCSKITNVFQSVDVLLEWMELDPVDTWEMGRNEVVAKYQGNRNVFIDYPEYAWLLFGKDVPQNMTTPSGGNSGGTTGGGNSGSSTDTPACTHRNTEVRNAKNSTCKAEGYTGDTYCLSCGIKVASGKAIDKKEHTPGTTTTTYPTCTEPGSVSDLLCIACGEVLKPGYSISANGHRDQGNDGICDECDAMLEVPTEPTAPPETQAPQPSLPKPSETQPAPAQPGSSTQTPGLNSWISWVAVLVLVGVILVVLIAARKRNQIS